MKYFLLLTLMIGLSACGEDYAQDVPTQTVGEELPAQSLGSSLPEKSIEESTQSPSLETADTPKIKEKTVEELKNELAELKRNNKNSAPLMQKSVVLKNGNQAVAEVQQPLVARSSGARYVFLGTFKTHYFFEEMMKKATEAGYSPIAGKVKMNGEWLKSVKIGPMSKKNAQLTMNKLKMDGFPQDIFVQK